MFWCAPMWKNFWEFMNPQASVLNLFWFSQSWINMSGVYLTSGYTVSDSGGELSKLYMTVQPWKLFFWKYGQKLDVWTRLIISNIFYSHIMYAFCTCELWLKIQWISFVWLQYSFCYYLLFSREWLLIRFLLALLPVKMCPCAENITICKPFLDLSHTFQDS